MNAESNNAALILEARRRANENAGRRGWGRSRVWAMTDEHFVQVVDWMLAGVPAKRVMELCRAELGMEEGKIPGKTTQSIFWEQFAPYWLAVRRQSNTQTIAEMMVKIEAMPLHIDPLLSEDIRLKGMELLQHPSPPPGLVKIFLTAVLTLRDQEDRAEDREFAREKFTAAQRERIAAGLEAIRAKIAKNPSALAAWEKLKSQLA